VKPLKSMLQRRAIELGEHILADVDLVLRVHSEKLLSEREGMPPAHVPDLKMATEDCHE